MVTRLNTAMSPTMTRTIKKVAVISRAWAVGRTQPYSTMGIRNRGQMTAIANIRPFKVCAAPSHEVTQLRICSTTALTFIIKYSSRLRTDSSLDPIPDVTLS